MPYVLLGKLPSLLVAVVDLVTHTLALLPVDTAKLAKIMLAVFLVAVAVAVQMWG
jgi:hypothetical protein